MTKQRIDAKILSDSLESTLQELDKNIANLENEIDELKFSKAYRIGLIVDKHLANPLFRPFGKIERVIKDRIRTNKLRKEFIAALQKYSGRKSKNKPKELKIGLIMRNGNLRPQSSGFIRLISPLTEKPLSEYISLTYFNGDITGDLSVHKIQDVFIVQRTAFSTAGKAAVFIENATKNASKLILDIDDAFPLIDSAHEQFAFQRSGLEALDLLVKNADEVWCSSGLIADLYKNARGRRIIRNSIDLRIWKNEYIQKSPKQKSRKIQMVYMGTQTHSRDFKLIIPALDRLNAAYPEKFELTVIGIAKNIPKRAYILPSPRIESRDTIYPNFVEWFSKQGPFDIGLSPLESSSFNNAKSDIKCMDYLALGIIPVVSNVTPYSSSDLLPFIFTSGNSTEEWVEVLGNLVGDAATLRHAKKTAKQGALYLQEKRNSEGIAKQLHQELFLKMIN